MKYLKTFESFSEKNNFEIITIDGLKPSDMTYQISKGKYNFDEMDFTVVAENDGVRKTLSVPHDLFIYFIKGNYPKLKKYLDSGGVENIEDILIELKEFEWDFPKTIQEYVENYVTIKSFNAMQDDLGNWDDSDQEDYENMIS